MPLQASPAGLLGRFAPSGFVFCTRILSHFGLASSDALLPRASSSHGLRAHENFRKKICVSQLTRIALKRVEMQKKITPLTQNASSKAQPYLPHVTPRVLRSDHAKFHANWSKTVGARGIQTDRQTHTQTVLLLLYIC